MSRSLPDPDPWWGIHASHGWVVLDRSPEIGDSSTPDLVFVRCADWTPYREKKKAWDPPDYTWATRYLESLAPDRRQVEEANLLKLKAEFLTRRSGVVDVLRREAKALREREIIANHERFLAELKVAPGTHWARSSGGGQSRRLTHCYSCKVSLDSAHDLQCTRCKWMICTCGACGCGYGRT